MMAQAKIFNKNVDTKHIYELTRLTQLTDLQDLQVCIWLDM